MPRTPITRRTALKAAAAGLAVPSVFRTHAHAAPSETVRHVSVGAGGMAGADIRSLTSHKKLKLVAVADIDASRAAAMKKTFPDITVYTDWREMFDKEKFDSANISTPDHMHAAPTMRAIRMGKHVYTQKPLTQTIYEARMLTEAAQAHKTISQMGIQIHSHPVHRSVVQTIHDGKIGKVKAVHSWSGKKWGDPTPKPERTDAVPAGIAWDLWLGVAAERPFIGGGYYHPGNWRKRLDFGTGTFGDMGCHILDPVFGSLGVKDLKEVKSVGGHPNATNWGLDSEVLFTFPGSQYTTETVTITWYDGDRRPPQEVQALLGKRKISDQGSIYIGTEGVLYSPYIAQPVLLPEEKFVGKTISQVEGANHYHQFVDAVLGQGKTSAPFAYAGPLTEMVLLGCLSTRFPNQALTWDPVAMKVTNHAAANPFVRRTYRKGWEEKGLSDGQA